MRSPDILIKNAKIVNYNAITQGDILVSGNKIKLIGNNLNVSHAHIIDAQGKYVIPGGIDTHVHFALPTFAGVTADDFLTGSHAAIWGGTTGVIDFVTPIKGQSLIEAFLQRRAEASDALVNVFFHVSPVEWTGNTAQEMAILIKDYGIRSFKVYMAYKKSIGIDDQTLINVLLTAKKLDALTIVHCENDEIIEYLRDSFYSAGHTDPLYHPLSRPDEAEADAISRLGMYAKILDVPVYAVHVSTEKGINIIKQRQREGVQFYAETCPQYLTFTDEVYDAPFEQAAKYVMSPPLRKEHDRQALWEALQDGTVSTIGTDHCSFTNEQKAMGKNDFRRIPNGAGGVEHRLEILYTLGVASGKITMQQFVSLTSYNAAQIFGLKGKGMIKEGYDADIVIWNPEGRRIISTQNHKMNADNNIYEGIEVIGQAETVILNGRIVKDAGQLFV